MTKLRKRNDGPKETFTRSQLAAIIDASIHRTCGGRAGWLAGLGLVGLGWPGWPAGLAGLAGLAELAGLCWAGLAGLVWAGLAGLAGVVWLGWLGWLGWAGWAGWAGLAGLAGLGQSLLFFWLGLSRCLSQWEYCSPETAKMTPPGRQTA